MWCTFWAINVYGNSVYHSKWCQELPMKKWVILKDFHSIWPNQCSQQQMSHMIRSSEFSDPLTLNSNGKLSQSFQFSSVAQSCPTLWDPMDCSMLGLHVHHQPPKFTQTHVHWVGDAIKPSHPLSSPSLPALNLSQHQGLFQWVSSSHQVAKLLEFQLQHQSFQWTFRTDFL